MRKPQELLQLLPLSGPVNIVSELAGGPASDSYLLESKGRQYVLRADKSLATDIGLNRAAEAEVLELVSKAGLGPKLVWADQADGLFLTEYLSGRSWSQEDFREQDNLLRLGKLFRTLHSLPAVGKKFEIVDWAARYSDKLNSDSAAALLDRIRRLDEQLRRQVTVSALCHNDPIAANIIDAGELRFIDWEYAGIGDPYFDLAVVVAHHELDPLDARQLLEAYQVDVTQAHEQRLQLACNLYDNLHLLWLLLVIRQGNATPFQRAAAADLGSRMRKLAN